LLSTGHRERTDIACTKCGIGWARQQSKSKPAILRFKTGHLGPAKRLDRVAHDSVRIRFADTKFVHFAAERTIDLEFLGPRSAQTFHIRLNAGRRSLLRSRAGEEKSGHCSSPLVTQAGAIGLSATDAWSVRAAAGDERSLRVLANGVCRETYIAKLGHPQIQHRPTGLVISVRSLLGHRAVPTFGALASPGSVECESRRVGALTVRLVTVGGN
jgi:hypothetical protein